ncbi:MFS transporter permease [Corynebacterium lactis RW2-5]|uniref:MFS transporter permease n=1 Tax=Corynebacterium lactis RW2-5 TaxID=1408189 RepID=A0A0K2GZ44_9CORY|nr:MFS transporter permease [Corynebacterium lactis RW2-5]
MLSHRLGRGLRRKAKCEAQAITGASVGVAGADSATAAARKQPIPREIWILVSAAFIIALGFGLIAPILPQFARSFDVGVFAASFVVSSFSIFRLLFAPASGGLVDKLGYRRTYLTGIAIVAVSTLLVGIAQNYWQLLAFRALGGIGSTMFTVSAMGLIVRISPPAIRGKSSAAYGSAFLLGNVFGPMIGAVMGAWGLRAPFFIYGGALIVATVIVAVMLSEEHLRHVVPKRTTPVLKFAEAVHDSAYRSALLGAFANGWSNFGVRVAIVPLFAAATFTHASGSGAVTATATAGLALTAFALGNVSALQFSGRLSDRIGRKPLLITGLAINGIFTGAIGLTSGAVALLALSAAAGFGAGMINPSQQAVLADVIGSDRQGGKVLANFQMAQDLGAISGPLIVGAIVDAAGFTAGFLVCGTISLAAMVGWIFGRETLPATAAEGGGHGRGRCNGSGYSFSSRRRQIAT